MASIQFTEADRDEHGFVKAPAADRSLVDLLPPTTDDRRPTTKVMLTRQDVISMAIVVPLLIVALLYISNSPSAPAIPAPVATAVGTVPTAAPLPTAPPVAMLPAFAAPSGAQLGQIEDTRQITPTAHFGADWIQADVAGSGLIWLRAADFPALAVVGPDLAPKAAVAPAAPPPAVDTPEPEPPCVKAGMGNQQVTVCGWEGDAALQAAAAAKWAAQYGGHVGAGDIHPSPQPWQRQDAIQNHLANEHTPTEETTP